MVELFLWIKWCYVLYTSSFHWFDNVESTLRFQKIELFSHIQPFCWKNSVGSFNRDDSLEDYALYLWRQMNIFTIFPIYQNHAWLLRTISSKRFFLTHLPLDISEASNAAHFFDLTILTNRIWYYKINGIFAAGSSSKQGSMRTRSYNFCSN